MDMRSEIHNFCNPLNCKWLTEEFNTQNLLTRHEIDKELAAIAKRLGGARALRAPNKEFPGVHWYHVDVLESFRLMLGSDTAMMWPFRKGGGESCATNKKNAK
jgi:hypothetical protein